MERKTIKVDTRERDLRIALAQAQGTDAIRIARENLENYLNSRLIMQLQHSKMQIAAKKSEAAGYTGKGALPD